jgi:hypothetical protein
MCWTLCAFFAFQVGEEGAVSILELRGGGAGRTLLTRNDVLWTPDTAEFGRIKAVLRGWVRRGHDLGLIQLELRELSASSGQCTEDGEEMLYRRGAGSQCGPGACAGGSGARRLGGVVSAGECRELEIARPTRQSGSQRVSGFGGG